MLPFKVFEDFIDDDFVSKYLSNDGYTEASVSNNDGTTQATDEKVRRSRVRFYQHDQIPLADKLLKYYSAYFDEGEITHFEYQLTRYDDVDSGFFHMHDDTIRSNTPDIRDYEYESEPYIVINTSCEHITQEKYKKWLANVPNSAQVIVQSNDYYELEEHVNCCKNLDQFARQSLLDIEVKDEIELPKYKRFMVIGKKK